MAFEGLTEKLNATFKKLRGKGRLTENDVREAMREVRLALLEALSPLLASCGRTLYVPEHCPVAGATILLCTALSGGTLEGRLTQAVDQYGAEHLALDLQRLEQEKDLAHLADLLGHSSIETTRIYVAVSARAHEQILEKMRLIV